jgi:hypothetical protein
LPVRVGERSIPLAIEKAGWEMPFRRRQFGVALGSLLLSCTAVASAQAQLLIVGNDEKIIFDDTGKGIPQPPGKDSVSIVDISRSSQHFR